MTRRLITTLALLIGTSIAFALASAGSPAVATSDVACPAGTEHTYRIDDLSGPTFTVPSAQDGWEVLGVSIRAGSSHYNYPNAVTGDIIDVQADTGHDISHAHLCTRRLQDETTTTAPTTTLESTTTTTTTTTTLEPTTTLASTTATVAPTSVGPTTTTLVQAEPPTTIAVGGGGPPSTVAQELPRTGAGGAQASFLIGVLLTLAGGILLIRSRRPRQI